MDDITLRRAVLFLSLTLTNEDEHRNMLIKFFDLHSITFINLVIFHCYSSLGGIGGDDTCSPPLKS